MSEILVTWLVSVFVGLLIILFLASIFDEAEFISAIASLVIGTAIYAILIAAW